MKMKEKGWNGEGEREEIKDRAECGKSELAI